MLFHLLRILSLVKSRQFSALRFARGSLGSVYSATELCPFDIGCLFRRTSTVEREERIHLSFAFSRRSPELALRFYDGDTVSKRLITVSDKFRTDLSATV